MRIQGDAVEPLPRRKTHVFKEDADVSGISSCASNGLSEGPATAGTEFALSAYTDGSTFLMGSSTHKMETSRMRKHFREPFLGKANVWRAVVCAIWHELALDSQLPRE